MRLGQYPAKLSKGTIAADSYGTTSIKERHRHRYEVNPKYIDRLEKGGLVFSGTSPDGTLMEIAELPRDTHPFFLGTQFHPEFLARPLAPHPLFTGFMKAAKNRRKENEESRKERQELQELEMAAIKLAAAENEGKISIEKELFAE